MAAGSAWEWRWVLEWVSESGAAWEWGSEKTLGWVSA
jgi:hypothetical protein